MHDLDKVESVKISTESAIHRLQMVQSPKLNFNRFPEKQTVIRDGNPQESVENVLQNIRAANKDCIDNSAEKQFMGLKNISLKDLKR